MAKIIEKTVGGERILVLAIREQLQQPFVAGPWLDLRFAFMVSLTGVSGVNPDDTTTGLAETIGTTGTNTAEADRSVIGFINSENFNVFLGFTNRGPGIRSVAGTPGTSNLVSSDAGIGTGTTFWRPANELSDGYTLQIIDQVATIAQSADGSEIHFAQTPATNYATLLMLRLQRPNVTTQSNLITLSTKQDVVNRSGDILFTSTPNKATMLTNLQNFPTSVQTLGPVALSEVPDTVYMYWPFRSSRLRLHAMEFLRFA